MIEYWNTKWNEFFLIWKKTSFYATRFYRMFKYFG